MPGQGEGGGVCRENEGSKKKEWNEKSRGRRGLGGIYCLMGVNGGCLYCMVRIPTRLIIEMWGEEKILVVEKMTRMWRRWIIYAWNSKIIKRVKRNKSKKGNKNATKEESMDYKNAHYKVQEKYKAA